MNATQSGMQPLGVREPNAKTITWKLVLTRTYQLYTEKFWIYFRIAIFPAILAYAFSYFAQIAARRLLGNSSFPNMNWKWLVMSAGIEWTRGAIYWTISAFFFAGIAATFVVGSTEDGPAISDAFTLPRKRLAAVATVALVTRTLFYIGYVISGFAVVQLVDRLARRNYWAAFCGMALMLLILSGLLAKFGLAIPELILNAESTAGYAIRKSLIATDGWELFLMAFLAKSAFLGFGIYWIAGQGLSWLWQHWTFNSSAFLWVQWSVYIFIAAVVETPLFIAFCMLHEELHPRRTSLALLHLNKHLSDSPER